MSTAVSEASRDVRDMEAHIAGVAEAADVTAKGATATGTVAEEMSLVAESLAKWWRVAAAEVGPASILIVGGVQ